MAFIWINLDALYLRIVVENIKTVTVNLMKKSKICKVNITNERDTTDKLWTEKLKTDVELIKSADVSPY